MSLFVWDSIQLIGEPGPPGAYKSRGRPPQPHTTTLPHREEAASATPTTGDRPPPARRQPPGRQLQKRQPGIQASTSGPSPPPAPRRPPDRPPRPPRCTLRPSVRRAPTMSAAAGLGPIPFAFVLLIALCSRVSAGGPPRPVPAGGTRGTGKGKGKGRAGGAGGVRPADRLFPAARLRPGLQRPVPVRPGPALPRRRQPGAGRLRLLPRVRQAAGRAVHRARPLRPAQGPLL